MDTAKVADVWLDFVARFSDCFTRPGTAHFGALLTGGLLAERRPLVTEIVTALNCQKQWRAAEWFLEEGKWPTRQVEERLCEMAAPAGRRWGRQVWAVDDMKALKNGKKIWGTCSFHEYTSRCCNRPETVWAHNWVVCGALERGNRSDFLPTMGRLYMRESQLPEGETFRKKPELAVEMARICARSSEGPHLIVFDGGYAIRSVVRPLTSPPEGQPRVEFLTRLRRDSRLYTEPPPRREGQMGRPRKWGYRLPAPRDAEDWPGEWQETEADMYGSRRSVRFKKVLGQWHPAGAEERVHAFAFDVEGYEDPWQVVTSDLRLTARQVLELYAARFAQEDAHRDLKQHIGLGTEQGRLKNVVLRSFQLRVAELTLLHLLRKKLNEGEGQWWPQPQWYPQKERGSVRDVKRVLRGAGQYFSQLDWRVLTSEKSPPGGQPRHRSCRKAA